MRQYENNLIRTDHRKKQNLLFFIFQLAGTVPPWNPVLV